MINHGSLVISLDFEMMWGMHDVATKAGYGMTNIQHVPDVIDKLLDLFKKYGVHATFAMVGMIMYDGKEELMTDLPDVHPSYSNPSCSPYGRVISEISKADEPLFFNKAIIEKLKKAKGIEIGTHTYCHYYCWEQGQTLEQFDADICKAVEVAKKNGVELRSIIFPRNQVSEEHLKVCAKYGITSYRGNAIKYFGKPKNSLQRLKFRILRIIDAYLNIGGMSSIPYDEINLSERPLNIRASRMLRPYSKRLACLDWLRLRRIKKEMIYAAKRNEIYHLWWHPHNFGANMEQNIKFLEGVLKCYKGCHEKYFMESSNMEELSKVLIGNE